MNGRNGLTAALIIFGVPVLACGGRLLEEGGANADAGGSQVATMQPQDKIIGVDGASPTTFGSFPCTAATAFYESCAPSGAAGGCPYWRPTTTESQPAGSIQGEVVAPGCQLEIVAPTSTGGLTCSRTDCVCSPDGMWEPISDARLRCPGHT